MYQKCPLALAIVALLLATASPTIQARRKDAKGKEVNEALQEDALLVKPLLLFGARLMQQVASEKEKQNIIISPVSVHSALNLLLLGSDWQSKTQLELIKTLGYESRGYDDGIHRPYAKLIKRIKSTLKLKPEFIKGTKILENVPPPKLDLWTMVVATSKSARPKGGYLKSIQKYYNSTLKMVDPKQEKEVQKLVDEINDWAENAGFQKDVINSNLIKDNPMLLISAIRVEAYWFKAFDEHEKADGIFYNHGLESELKNGTALVNSEIWGKYVEFRQGKADEDLRHRILAAKFGHTYKTLVWLNFFAVEVPLKGDISLTCFMPFKKGSGDTQGSLAELEAELLKVDGGKSKMSKVLDILGAREAEVKIGHIRMPKFHFENDLSLKGSLESMGIKRAFTPQAEFTKMSPAKLHVGEVKHQAMIETNKKGLKAAAITIITGVTSSLHPPPPSPTRVILDSPFLFVLRYNRIPLFMGHLDHI